jgi:hypothetical protein
LATKDFINFRQQATSLSFFELAASAVSEMICMASKNSHLFVLQKVHRTNWRQDPFKADTILSGSLNGLTFELFLQRGNQERFKPN